MTHSKLDRSVAAACGMVMLFALTAFAEPSPTPGNPDTNASDRNFDTNQPNSIPGGMQKAEDGSNRAMNKVDRGVHKGIRKTKHGARRAKQKAKNAADTITEPAVKPGY
jgi:hypothetical protein